MVKKLPGFKRGEIVKVNDTFKKGYGVVVAYIKSNIKGGGELAYGIDTSLPFPQVCVNFNDGGREWYFDAKELKNGVVEKTNGVSIIPQDKSIMDSDITKFVIDNDPNSHLLSLGWKTPSEYFKTTQVKLGDTIIGYLESLKSESQILNDKLTDILTSDSNMLLVEGKNTQRVCSGIYNVISSIDIKRKPIQVWLVSKEAHHVGWGEYEPDKVIAIELSKDTILGVKVVDNTPSYSDDNDDY